MKKLIILSILFISFVSQAKNEEITPKLEIWHDWRNTYVIFDAPAKHQSIEIYRADGTGEFKLIEIIPEYWYNFFIDNDAVFIYNQYGIQRFSYKICFIDKNNKKYWSDLVVTYW